MKIFEYKNLTAAEIDELCKRPASMDKDKFAVVREILERIKSSGTSAVLEYAAKFDDNRLSALKVRPEEIESAGESLSAELKTALKNAHDNIYKFHLRQYPENYSVETTSGVICERRFSPIENVGLYVPGGTAPLPSTLMMLAVPAKIAGCKRIIVCTPSHEDKLNPVILYTAELCGITELYKIGGAQAIGAMAFGIEELPKVDKIFGPGNQYVTIAKMLVSGEYAEASIDMPAGPSEVLLIADEFANPEYAAADLLSQAEHGEDSQSILVTDSPEFADKVISQVEIMLETMERKSFAEKSIDNSFVVLTENIEQAFNFSNIYAPEHLIINLRNDKDVEKLVTNAGSVFIGENTPESAGDYASGTNHTLPTSGFAKSSGGVSVNSFMKATTFQRISKSGLKKLSKTIVNIAEAEGLQAHAEAVKVRLKDEY